MGLDVDNLTNSVYVIYIIVGYFIKYCIVLHGYVMIYLLLETYKYMCSAFVKVADFFKILISPPKLKIFGLKFTNYFPLLMRFSVC